MAQILQRALREFKRPSALTRYVQITALVLALMAVGVTQGISALQTMLFVSAFAITLSAGLFLTRNKTQIAPSTTDLSQTIPEFQLRRDGTLKPNPAAAKLLAGSVQRYREADIGQDLICHVGGHLMPFRLERPDPSDRHRVSMIPSSVMPQENALHGLFEQIPIALLMLDASGQVERANAIARDYMGLTLHETPNFVDIVENNEAEVHTWLKDILAGQRDVRDAIFDATRADADAHLQFTARVVHLGIGPRILAVIHDATEMKSLEAQFVQSQKMQAIGQLAGGVAHDFNNLLTAISGYCDLLLLRHEEGDPDYGDLIQIEQNANRAASLVGQLLAFSRKQTMQSKRLDIEEAISDLAHLLNRLLGERMHLRIESQGPSTPINADKRQLEQVIMNLVVNARDAMPDGGEVLLRTETARFAHDTRIDRATVRAGDYLKISVCDSGTGVPKSLRSKIFEPFYTTKEVGEGTGLGLSTVYGIVKQMGGYIFIHDAVDVGLSGASFEIYLPAATDLPIEQTAVKTPVTAPTEDREIVVLLVEDEAPVRTFATKAMKMRGFKVVEAASGEEALEVLNTDDTQFDVIISDVVMPGMDGPTWVKKALEQRPGSKVIFVSGYAEESFEEEHRAIPEAVFLAKPFSLKDLIATVQRVAG